MKMFEPNYARSFVNALMTMPACDFPSDRDLLEIYKHMPEGCKEGYVHALLKKGVAKYESGTVVTTKRGLLISEPGRK